MPVQESMKAQVFVTLKKGVLDPQGKAVVHALHSLDYSEVKDIRQGKFFEVQLEGESIDKAKERIGEMCEKLLANVVIEDYRFEIIE